MDRLRELYNIFQKDAFERQVFDSETQKVKNELYSFFDKTLNLCEFKFAEELVNAAFAEVEEKAFISGLKFSVNLFKEIYRV
ncbi:MAG: hypothetical protein VB120_02115 [Lachnospiraceae bacterium]|nr:hypothetical protein [Lachnospiraceae bacterium]